VATIRNRYKPARPADAPRPEAEAGGRARPIADRLAEILAEYEAKAGCPPGSAREVSRISARSTRFTAKMSPDEVAFCRPNDRPGGSRPPTDPAARQKPWSGVVNKARHVRRGRAYGDEFRSRHGKYSSEYTATTPRPSASGPSGMDKKSSRQHQRLRCLTGFYAFGQGPRGGKVWPAWPWPSTSNKGQIRRPGTRKVTRQAKKTRASGGSHGRRRQALRQGKWNSPMRTIPTLPSSLKPPATPDAIRAGGRAALRGCDSPSTVMSPPPSTVRHRDLENPAQGGRTPKWNGKPADVGRSFASSLTFVARKKTLADGGQRPARTRWPQPGRGQSCPRDRRGSTAKGQAAQALRPPGQGRPSSSSWGPPGAGPWPCDRIPQRARAGRAASKGKPFALLGCQTTAARIRRFAIKTMKDERMTWPHWIEGDDSERARSSSRYITSRSYPNRNSFLDAKGDHPWQGGPQGRITWTRLVDDLLKENTGARRLGSDSPWRREIVPLRSLKCESASSRTFSLLLPCWASSPLPGRTRDF